MTDNMIELGKRAVACKGWRWMPGMRTQSGIRLVVVWGTYNTASVLSDGIDDAHSETVSLVDELPDLTDPATLGCLLSLVREAWGPDLRIFRDGVWFVEYVPQHAPENMYGQRTFTASTKAEALVDALVNAP